VIWANRESHLGSALSFRSVSSVRRAHDGLHQRSMKPPQLPMLSRYDLHRLKTWQLQLKEAVAAQEYRLKAQERLVRRTLKTGRVPEEVYSIPSFHGKGYRDC
jgi:hypothetical protein